MFTEKQWSQQWAKDVAKYQAKMVAELTTVTAERDLFKKETVALAKEALDLLAALKEEQAENAKMREALEPFANYACDPPCGCHNCIAKSALERKPE